MERKYKRKIINYSIKTKMQLRLLFKVLSISMIGIGLMAVIFYTYSNREIGQSYRMFHVHAQNFLDYLLPAIILSVLAAFLLAVVIALFFPHRIAGPLYRIERDLKDKIGEGDLGIRVAIRRGDELSDLADALNAALEKLKLRIENIKKPAEELQSHIASLKGNADKETEILVKEINEAVQKFRL
jgi:methyl-accepting chemotaxis protein